MVHHLGSDSPINQVFHLEVVSLLVGCRRGIPVILGRRREKVVEVFGSASLVD